MTLMIKPPDGPAPRISRMQVPLRAWRSSDLSAHVRYALRLSYCHNCIQLYTVSQHHNTENTQQFARRVSVARRLLCLQPPSC